MVEGLIAPKSRMGGASRPKEADVMLEVAPVLQRSFQTHISEGTLRMGLFTTGRQKVTGSLASMSSAPSKPHATILGSPPPPLLGNSQSSSQGQLKARDVCVDLGGLGQGFLEEEFPGKLMDSEILPRETCCCQPGKVPPLCCLFLLWRALGTGGD